MVNVLMPFEAYHFIPTILFLYIVFYLAAKLDQRGKVKYPVIIAVFAAIALIYYFLFYDYRNENILQHFTLIETISYFIPMLLGGMAKKGIWLKRKAISAGLIVIMFILYVYQSFHPFEGVMKILQPCIGLFFAYSLGCLALSAEDKLPTIKLVDFIAMVTLEAYLVQFISIDAFSVVRFPVNIVYHVICVIAVAHCLHRASNAIMKASRTVRLVPAQK